MRQTITCDVCGELIGQPHYALFEHLHATPPAAPAVSVKQGPWSDPRVRQAVRQVGRLFEQVRAQSVEHQRYRPGKRRR
jgi:hypothetical protein